MDLGIAPAAKLTVVFVAVLFRFCDERAFIVNPHFAIVTLDCFVTIYTEFEFDSLKKTQIAPGFVQNVTFLTFRTHFSQIN